MPDHVALPSSDAELRAHVERALTSQYELDRELGRGGMGIVYRAKDRRLKRTVAIKLLPPELAFRSEIRSRFLREAETAAQLNHPNIVPIYSVDEKDGLVYFVMSCVEGDNLAKLMYERGRFSPAETRRIMREVADALAYAHQRGVVHRDIKPDNIILDAQSLRPMVTDFGIARAITEGSDARLTATGMAIGTPAYMAPEQAAGEREVDGRTDLYSLGIVAYQMLTGELPFTASSTPAMLVKHISEAPTPVERKRADIPPDLARAVMLLLEKSPENRFPDAAALVAALDSGNVPQLPVRASTGSLPQPLAGDASASSMGFSMDVRSSHTPSPDELARWNAPEVVEFRKKLAPYLGVNFFFLVLSIFTSVDLLSITAIWTVYIAWRYAKLWSAGYDWRHVFKQPQDRLLVDVVAESVDDTVAMFDPNKREAVRAKRRATGNSGGALRVIFDSNRDAAGTSTPNTKALPAQAGLEDKLQLAGAHAPTVRTAMSDRDDVLRLVGELPKAQRDAISGKVIPSAVALADKVRDLAVQLGELERADQPGALAALDEQIATLEAQANPLDPSSEDRVRRLAGLRRQRRGILDLQRRREQTAAKLETCRIALQNMRFDMLRLKTGGQSQEHLTTLAEQAMELAGDVDAALHAGDELSRLGSRRGTRGA